MILISDYVADTNDYKEDYDDLKCSNNYDVRNLMADRMNSLVFSFSL